MVQYLGFCITPLCIVTELCEHGSLQKLLRTPEFEMSMEFIIRIIRDIAAGMLHLAKEDIVHRDLAARNVLVRSNISIFTKND